MQRLGIQTAGPTLVITDLCVFDVRPDGAGLELSELAPGVAVDEVRAKTDAAFFVSESLRTMDA